MGFRLTNPIALVGLATIIFAALLWRGNPWRLPAARRRFIFALRATLLLTLVLALAGSELDWKARREAVIFVVDGSASVSGVRQQIERSLQEAIAARPAGYAVGVITVGREAAIELAPSEAPAFRGLEAAVDANYTNLAAGLRLAYGLFPDDARRRIVIVSDGQENIGNALDEAKALAGRGVRVDVLPVTAETGPDVLVRALEAPGVLRAGDSFGLAVTIESTAVAGATLSVYGDRRLISEQRVSLHPGVNRFHIGARVDTPGFHAYRAVIRADNDSRSENNEAAAFVRVSGPPTVLVVEGRPGAGANLVAALASRAIETRVCSPSEFPASLSELRQYANIVLCNVAATDLGDRALAQLEVAVRDLGIGLVMTGGEDSFGPGGYFRTPVERALPVYMDLRGKGELPSLGLVLVIDKSGSMGEGAYGVTKVDLAKEAAIRASEVLAGQDRIGVIAFDEAAKWVVALQTIDQPETIEDAIGTIRAGGGTDIYPALALAYEALKDSPTKLRHIILLTDGMSARGGDYDALVERMKEARITLSTVAVGSDADRALLSQLATAGGGRYYATAEYGTIPKIFSKETILATRSYLVNRTFTPAVGTESALLRGAIAGGLPALDGYVATSPKPAAELALVSDAGDPIFAGWQYGLGRAVAWTPDIAGRWTRRWVGWDGFGRLLVNAVEWTLPTAVSEGATVSTAVDGGTARVTYELSALPEAGMQVEATVVSPDLRSVSAPLKAVAPGRYELAFPAASPGVYQITINQTGAGGQSVQTSAGIVVPYSPEYLPARSQDDLLPAIAAAAGGKVLSAPAEAFAGHAPPVRARLPLSSGLLALAVALLPFDIAARRLYFSLADVRALWGRLRGRLASGENATAPTALSALTELQTQRRRARQRLHGRAADLPLSPPLPQGDLRASESANDTRLDAAEPTVKENRPPGGPGDYTARLLAAKRRTRR